MAHSLSTHEIARIVGRQSKLRAEIDAIVADLEGKS